MLREGKFLGIPPRDFTTGNFLIRSTPVGTLPLDADLFGSIRRGFKPSVGMPAFAFLSDREVWGVVAYLKTLSPRWKTEKPGTPLELPAPNAYRTGSGMPGPAYWQQQADYDIRVSLDTSTHTVRGVETIRYTNNSPDTLRYVWIQLDQNQSGPDSRLAMLAPTWMGGRAEPGFVAGYTIERVNALRPARPGVVRPAPTPLTYRINNTMMRVNLDQPLPPSAPPVPEKVIAGVSGVDEL